ncbi:hypothetical protein NQ318_014478 [Aromia moschata]|uniref:Partial AB-hydrolase lipase domain-containing protein n=1 Tax=Aromia moschata TaxID=1265417 RepID=A0AAV8YNA7_9CUCU|nr:hypothetical protein NQ318_014478 [Aromia moschata]
MRFCRHSRKQHPPSLSRISPLPVVVEKRATHHSIPRLKTHLSMCGTPSSVSMVVRQKIGKRCMSADLTLATGHTENRESHEVADDATGFFRAKLRVGNERFSEKSNVFGVKIAAGEPLSRISPLPIVVEKRATHHSIPRLKTHLSMCGTPSSVSMVVREKIGKRCMSSDLTLATGHTENRESHEVADDAIGFFRAKLRVDNSVTDYLKILSDLFVFNPGTFLKSYGYPFENYEVTTEDGYILALHRIPYGRSESSKTEGKPVVLLMHGLGSSSADYFILGPERSLPLLLADSGYDVWLGNNRGSTWSQKHISLDPAENKTFWDFSFHELGVYDLPVIIDHVLNTTGVNTVSYVGHSQGSTQFFAMAAAKPEYNDKINLMVALAPVAYVEHIGEEVVQFLKNFFLVVDMETDKRAGGEKRKKSQDKEEERQFILRCIEYVTNALNITYVLPHSPLASMALSLVCSDRSSLQSICVSMYNSLGGESTQLNKTTLSIMVQTFPGGSAIKERKHYLQEVKSARFRQYDYGIVENYERYGQTEPPDYDVSKITVPVALYPGGKDIIAVVTCEALDVDRLAQELPNLIRKQLVDDCSHLDFIMGRNSSVLYAELRDLINDYNGLSKSYSARFLLTMVTLLVCSLLLLASRITEGRGFSVGELPDGLKDLNWGELFEFHAKSFIKSYGYPFEEHEAVTDDGYILTIHRIPYGRSESCKTEGRPAVVFMHGLGSTSAEFFILGPERSLPLLLADFGYDVWLGNNRGNTWSQKHVILDPKIDKEFWDYSFSELGTYDLPAIIDHVLSTTGLETLSYVGQSQGTTQFFAMASTKTEYNDKINLMVAQAPVAYLEHTQTHVAQILKDYLDAVDYITNALNVTYVLPYSPLVSLALSFICSDRSPLQGLCVALYNAKGGESIQLNKTTLSILVQTYPGGSAIKEWKHVLQEVKSGHFRQYDYGSAENTERYGAVEPPDYNISKITAPVVLYAGGRDILAVAADVDRLAQELPNLVAKHELEDFSHLDFVKGERAPALYNEIKDLINKYNGITSSDSS